MEWLVYSPPFSRSAGVRVLHRTAHLLNVLGEAAYISTNDTNPEWFTPTGNPSGAVIIYPEIYNTNPLGKSDYLIYGLNAPGAMGGTTRYKTDDIVIGYLDRWAYDYGAALGRNYPQRNTVTIGLIDPALFHNPGTDRTGRDLCWIYKGAGLRARFHFPGEENFDIITMEWPSSRAELSRVLQNTNTLWSYDRDSALLYEAYLCGCKVMVMGLDGNPAEWTPDHFELNNMIARDERDQYKVLRIKNIYLEEKGMRKTGSEFFVAIYTNECKKYCDEKFFSRLRELTEGLGCTIRIVDNSATETYYHRLCGIITDLKFTCPVFVDHIEVSRNDKNTQFQRNVTESLEFLQAEFLAGSWEFFVTLETDIFPKCDIFSAFLEAVNKADIIGGIYYQGFHSPMDFEPESADMIKTHHVLSGCTLYKRAVLKKYKFRWSLDNLAAFPDAWMSHDAGKEYILANYQKIKCDHMHSVNGDRGHGALV